MHICSWGTEHNLVCSHAQIEGYIHRENNHLCDDAVFCKLTDRYLFYGLADGQSGAAYGMEGGRACLEMISEYIDSVGVETFIEVPFPDELPCTFVKTIRRKLFALANDKNSDLREFASTFLAIAIDLKSGNYMLLHLGDGCVLSIPCDGDPAVISAPDNGVTCCHTWRTTSENAVSHFRVTFGSLENKKRIILLSDGAVCFCRGRRIPWRMTELLKNRSWQQLHDCLIRSNPVDDATCIILDICRNAKGAAGHRKEP